MEYWQSINPATGKEFGDRYKLDSEEHVQQMIERANSAWLAWKQLGLTKRLVFLASLADGLAKRREELANLIALEMGKPVAQGLREVDKCGQLCRYYAENSQALLADSRVDLPGLRGEVRTDSLGIILGIMPWNYPVWQIMRFAIPTLVAGNVVLLKPAPNMPQTSLLVEELIRESGLPDSCYQNVLVEPAMIESILADARVAGVSLTGSVRAGKAVAAVAAAHLKPSVLELGGNDPYVVLADADLELAAKVCVQARLMNSGQVCIAAKRIIVDRQVYDEFLSLVEIEVAKYTYGDPLADDTQMGPLARADIRDEVHRQVQGAVADGAKLVCGGVIPKGEGFYYPPTVLVDVTSDMLPFREEIFGPVVTVIAAENSDDALRLANASIYGLGGAIFTRDSYQGRVMAQKMSVGCVGINMAVSSVIALPFGGIKHSGWGRELGREGLLSFVNKKTLLISSA